MNEEELILKNINLIYVTLKKLNLFDRRDEFYDVGMIGLVKGAKKYNPNLGYTAGTYLGRCIYNEILMYIRNNNSTKKIPENMTTYLSTKTTDKLSVGDLIKDDFDVEEDLIRNEQIEILYKEISKLTKNEQLVLNLYYGLNGYKAKRQTEISEIIGLTQAHVSRIKNKAIEKLRKEMKNGNT